MDWMNGLKIMGIPPRVDPHKSADQSGQIIIVPY